MILIITESNVTKKILRYFSYDNKESKEKLITDKLEDMKKEVDINKEFEDMRASDNKIQTTEKIEEKNIENEAETEKKNTEEPAKKTEEKNIENEAETEKKDTKEPAKKNEEKIEEKPKSAINNLENDLENVSIENFSFSDPWNSLDSSEKNEKICETINDIIRLIKTKDLYGEEENTRLKGKKTLPKQSQLEIFSKNFHGNNYQYFLLLKKEVFKNEEDENYTMQIFLDNWDRFLGEVKEQNLYGYNDFTYMLKLTEEEQKKIEDKKKQQKIKIRIQKEQKFFNSQENYSFFTDEEKYGEYINELKVPSDVNNYKLFFELVSGLKIIEFCEYAKNIIDQEIKKKYIKNSFDKIVEIYSIELKKIEQEKEKEYYGTCYKSLYKKWLGENNKLNTDSTMQEFLKENAANTLTIYLEPDKEHRKSSTKAKLSKIYKDIFIDKGQTLINKVIDVLLKKIKTISVFNENQLKEINTEMKKLIKKIFQEILNIKVKYTIGKKTETLFFGHREEGHLENREKQYKLFFFDYQIVILHFFSFLFPDKTMNEIAKSIEFKDLSAIEADREENTVQDRHISTTIMKKYLQEELNRKLDYLKNDLYYSINQKKKKKKKINSNED